MRSCTVAGCLLGFSLCAVFSQAPGPTDQVAVQAEFLKRVDVRKLAVGAKVFAQVTVDWNGPDCALKQGAILEATVEAAEVRNGHAKSSLALSFGRAQCNQSELAPIKLVLVSVADAPVNLVVSPNVQFHTPGFASSGAGTRFAIETDPNATWYNERMQMSGVVHRFPMKPNLHPGDVVGIGGLKLNVGAGPHESSVLSSVHSDVSLGASTQLLLVPESVAFLPVKHALSDPHSAVRAKSASVKPANAPVLPAINALDECTPPGCAVDLPATAKELDGQTPESIAVRPLGYRTRHRRTLEDFDNEQNLAWLGPHQLLFAFNSHALIPRASAGKGTVRVVRAVLLDPSTRTALRTLDWEIRDKQRFLWQLGPERILVHAGDEMRVYRAGLELERTIPLAGSLAFLRTSPNGELIALATVRERHSPELHASLREQLGEEPEEDVDITLLDKSFNTIATARTVSGMMPPTLVNDGQVKLQAEPDSIYRLVLDNRRGTGTILARVKSLCTPQVSSVAPDLLFLLTCETKTGINDYRVLHADGKLLLRGSSEPEQVGFEAAGNESTFALKFVTGVPDISPVAGFKAEDLKFEEVRVYRRKDGKRLISARVNDPVTSLSNYALSPDGSQLAILSASEIKLFHVPAD